MKQNRFAAFALAMLCLFFLLAGCSGASPEIRHNPVTAEPVTEASLRTGESDPLPPAAPTDEPATTAAAAPTTEAPTELPAETAPPTSVEEPEPAVTESAAETDATEPEPSEAPPDRAAPASETEATEPEVTYIANTNTKKFHYPSCSSVTDMKESNKWYFTGTREELIAQGYAPCKRCKP